MRRGFDAFSKKRLLTGVDQLGYIHNQLPVIQTYEQRIGDRVLTR